MSTIYLFDLKFKSSRLRFGFRYENKNDWYVGSFYGKRKEMWNLFTYKVDENN